MTQKIAFISILLFLGINNSYAARLLIPIEKNIDKEKVDDSKLNSNKTLIQSKNKQAEITVTQKNKEQKAKVENIVKWLAKFDTYVKKIGGRKFILYNAILFCYYSNDVDNVKLYEKVFVNNYHNFHIESGIQGYLQQIEHWYNYNTKNATYLIHIERDFLNAKISTKEYDN